MNTIYLIKQASDKSYRLVELDLKQVHHSWYTIYRRTGILNGTMTDQPDVSITEGKASRTIEQQAELQFNSILNKYLDQGYKNLKMQYNIDHPKYITAETLKAVAETGLTDTKGFAKPMLAKQPYPYVEGQSFVTLGASDKRFMKIFFGSYKINGVRCLLHYNYDAKLIRSASRGGKTYDAVLKHIFSDPVMQYTMRESPDLILDGELYIHGRPLEYISGISRQKIYNPKIHGELQFYLFDVLTEHDFAHRYNLLRDFYDRLYKNTILFKKFEILNMIKLVDHIPVVGFDHIMSLHNEAVNNGYEGLILRDPDYGYGLGTRDNRMYKIKLFDDEEFTILGKSDGLRKEDMVFVLALPGGKSFEAKPVGTAAQREFYSDNIALYIGHKATVKFFGYTAKGVPSLPTLLYIRS